MVYKKQNRRKEATSDNDKISICKSCSKTAILDTILCDLCKFWIHRKCTYLTPLEFKQLGKSEDPWYCPDCIKENIPFSTISDEDKLCDSLGINGDLCDIYNSYLEFDKQKYAKPVSILEIRIMTLSPIKTS